jgi:PilZN3 domain
VTTNQQLIRYFEEYGDQEVTFTRQVNQILGLLPKYVYLKCQADTLSCILYSSSMRGAKVIANLRIDSLRMLQQASEASARFGGALSLRFCFAREGGEIPLAFFVSARLTAQTAYNRETPELYFLSLEYTHRPPDDLIEILGGLLEASRNAQKRAEERIEVTPASMRHLGLESREAALTAGGAEGRCLLRDLSFSGAKVLVHGKAEAFLDKQVRLRPAFADPKAQVILSGRVLRWEGMANREDIGAIAILFAPESVPMQYKLAINAGLRALRQGNGPARRDGGPGK